MSILFFKTLIHNYLRYYIFHQEMIPYTTNQHKRDTFHDNMILKTDTQEQLFSKKPLKLHLFV